MARTGGTVFDDFLCAEHDGSISSFKRLNLKLDDLAEFKKLFVRDSVNIAEHAKVVGGIVAGTAVFAPFALLAAPGIAAALGSAGVLGAASTGTAIASLSGAALANASLAAIGGGTMAAGSVVMTAAGAALGGWQGGRFSNSYFAEVEGFQIRRVHQGKHGKSKQGRGQSENRHGVIFVNGFLSQHNRQTSDWTDHLQTYFPNSNWYHLDWEAHNLEKLGSLIAASSHKAGIEMAKELAKQAAKHAPKKIAPISWISNVLDVFSNPWHSSMVKAAMTGVLLADAIARTPGWTFTLVGHSLGARVIYYALEALSTRTRIGPPVIDNVYLLGGAVGGGAKDSDGWAAAAKAVSGRIHNCFSENDDVLKYFYQAANGLVSTPIGYSPICLRSRKIPDYDFSDEVNGHMEWKPQFGEIYRQIHGI